MPFNRSLLTKLRKAVGSQNKLAVEVSNCNKEYNPNSKFVCTPQTINNWEKGHTSPRIDRLDLLSLVAEKYRFDGKDFYTFPK